jgi:hypothetical protein
LVTATGTSCICNCAGTGLFGAQCENSLTQTYDCLYGNSSTACGPFIADIAEGDGENAPDGLNWFELHNPTTTTILLANFAVAGVEDGGTGHYNEYGDPNGNHETWREFALGAAIAPGGTYMICDEFMDVPGLLDVVPGGCDEFTSMSSLSDGNDGLCLVFGDQGSWELSQWQASYAFVDCVGTFGHFHTQGWDVCGVPAATTDHRLMRQCDVTVGNLGDWSTSAGTTASNCEWNVESAPATFIYAAETQAWIPGGSIEAQMGVHYGCDCPTGYHGDGSAPCAEIACEMLSTSVFNGLPVSQKFFTLPF